MKDVAYPPPTTNTHTVTNTFKLSQLKHKMSTRTFSDQQQANFAKNSDPSQGISLCIPRVFTNIGWRRIKQHMIEANLGFVERVDVIPVTKFGKVIHKRAFVHFAAGKWNMRDATARQALKVLQEGKKIKLEYEAPWYWLVGISGAERPDEAPKPRERKVKIDFTPQRVHRDIDELHPVPESVGTTAPAEKEEEYDTSAQPDEEMRANDPIEARAHENELNTQSVVAAAAAAN